MTRATLLAAVAGVLAAPGLSIWWVACGCRDGRRAGWEWGCSRRSVAGSGFGLRGGSASGSWPRGWSSRRMTSWRSRAGAALAGAAVAVAALPIAPGRLGPALLVALPAAAFLAPDLWLHRRTSERTRVIEAELADVLDLIRVAVAAGLTPSRALGEVGARHPGVLPAELRRTADRMRYGVPRASAYDDLERRCPAPGVAALVAALRRADRHGAPLAAALSADAAHGASAAGATHRRGGRARRPADPARRRAAARPGGSAPRRRRARPRDRPAGVIAPSAGRRRTGLGRLLRRRCRRGRGRRMPRRTAWPPATRHRRRRKPSTSLTRSGIDSRKDGSASSPSSSVVRS